MDKTEAREQARAVAKDASSESKQVAHSAASEARHVAGDVKGEAKHVAQEVSNQAHALAENARSELKHQANGQTYRIAESLTTLSNELQALLDGHPEEAGKVREYVDQAQTKLREAAKDLENKGFDGVISDVESFARRRPGAFLLGAGAAGFLAGRLFRGKRDADKQHEQHEKQRKALQQTYVAEVEAASEQPTVDLSAAEATRRAREVVR